MLITLQLCIAPAWGADDVSVERMAMCTDSWFVWQKSGSLQLKDFGDHFRVAFVRKESDPYFVPKASVSIAGLRVLQAYPGSVGMGVGFSVLVDATFEKAKQTLEKKLGKSLRKCSVGDGMRTCELEIGPMRTLMLMAEDSAKSSSTLLGCYYYYEK